jgi:FkbH-like protein
MTEDRLREIVAAALTNPQVKVRPEDITDAASTDTISSWDSHAVMEITMSWEIEADYILSDDEISTLTSWPAVLSVLLSHEKGNVIAFYKALVLDADGTLWKGILDEGGITMTPEFLAVQGTYFALRERGVILAIASKNEQVDLENAIGSIGLLDVGDFTVIRGGWGNKVTSLRNIAKTLNIGLDAIVFVDDSSFECEYVRSHLPEVKVVQVPQNLVEYPRVAQEIANLFPTLVDVSKTEEYRALAAAERTRPQFKTEEEYLASLGIEVEIHCNRSDEIPRIAELCQKVNQFNLTTVRYTEGQIAQLMAEGYADVYSLNVKDKFGDQGLCGVLIVDHGQIDEFCLSCRILGRGIEFSPWKLLFANGQLRYMDHLRTCYIATEKNHQVADFWPKVGLIVVAGADMRGVNYQGSVKVDCPSWIKVTRA